MDRHRGNQLGYIFPEYYELLSPFLATDMSMNDNNMISQAGSNSVRQSPSGLLMESTNTDGMTETKKLNEIFTCTYHGCTLRFETMAKLKRHMRETHQTILNHSAQPYNCKRINPSTGKPCNTHFSRSYELSRHEDSTHNPCKPKLQCCLCPDKNTFSRKDALARHMRKRHPG